MAIKMISKTLTPVVTSVLQEQESKETLNLCQGARQGLETDGGSEHEHSSLFNSEIKEMFGEEHSLLKHQDPTWKHSPKS